MFPTKKKDISNLQEEQEEQNISRSLDEDEGKRGKRLENHDKLITIFLKIGLSIFIAYLILSWFDFMKGTVNFDITHFNILEKNVPESVIIATITLGATITGLMVIILKGLFGNPKE